MNRRPTGRFIDDFPATAALLLVIVGFYVIEVVLQFKLSDDPKVSAFGIRLKAVYESLGALYYHDVVERYEAWRIIAACFLHGGVIHLLFNGYALWSLGHVCEPMLGWERFMASYVICGIGGGLASLGWKHVAEIGRPSVGASGAILGLIGLLLSHGIRHRDRLLRDQILMWLVYMAIFSLYGASVIDHAGHIGGLVTGFALGWFVPRYTSSESAKRWRALGWVAIGICVVSLGFSIWGLFRELVANQNG